MAIRPGAGSHFTHLLLAAAFVVLTTGCGGGSTPVDGHGGGQSEAEWVKSVMQSLYLWSDRVPAVELANLPTAEKALEAMRVSPPDRYSYVESRSAYDGFFDEGLALGLGIGYRVVEGSAVLRFVQPESPAGRAGLRRGDRIESVDGVPVAALIAESRLSAAFGPAQEGLVVRLVTDRAGARSDTSLAKAWYTVAPVLATRIIEYGKERIGYVALHTFTEPARADWAKALDALRASGVGKLIVDLRDNGGGRLYVAAEVAGSLAPAPAVGQVFAALRYNARYAANDVIIDMPRRPTTGGFEQIAWLVSDATCSASESLIAGLRPFRADALIGTATCGKPVGFNPQTRGEKVLSAVSFASWNRDGFGEWFDGLVPTCTVSTEPFVAYGDSADPRVAEALVWLTLGRCSVPLAAAPDRVPKTVAGNLEQERPTGLASETGLY
jgi:C-terminal processing protease CtpA/Prc